MFDNTHSSQWGFRQSGIPVSHMEGSLIYDHRVKMYVTLLPLHESPVTLLQECKDPVTLREESVVMEPMEPTIAGTWKWGRSRKPCSPISESL